MIVGFLFQGYCIVRVVLAWISVVSLLISPVPSIRSVTLCSFVFVSIIFIQKICLVLNIVFLFIRVAPTCFGLHIDIQFSLNHYLSLQTLLWT